MEIVPATPEQIAEFKMAAAARYAEKGIAPDKANELFNAQMAKMAAELQITEPVTEVKKAEVKVSPERIEKIANELAATLSRKRVVKAPAKK